MSIDNEAKKYIHEGHKRYDTDNLQFASKATGTANCTSNNDSIDMPCRVSLFVPLFRTYVGLSIQVMIFDLYVRVFFSLFAL